VIGVGIIGLGGIGAVHAAALAEFGDRVRLVAYSGSGTAADWPAADRLAVEAVLEHPAVDVVAVCTPSQTHADLALRALAAGKHVVVEKPLATTVEAAEEVVAAARQVGRQVSVMAQRRYEPHYRRLHEIVASGGLGPIRLATTQVHWWRDDAYYGHAAWRRGAAAGGSLMNQGVHNVDLLRWLAGPPVSVTAQQATLGHRIEAEDTTVATIRFASGALGVLSISTATPPGTPAVLELHGGRGSVALGQGAVLRWDLPDVAPPDAGPDAGSGAADPAAIGNLGHRRQWQDVLAALEAGRPVPIGAEDGLQTVRLICAIYAAAAAGGTVEV
jgi:predicted dehydrogenase